jgi:type II secretory pathway pseudopilin PulG
VQDRAQNGWHGSANVLGAFVTTPRRQGRGSAALWQAGLTLLELILGLAILATVTVGLNQLADRWADDTESSIAASQVRTFADAARSYIKDNYAAVQGVATASAPAIIDVATLIAAGKLPVGYQNRNAFAQATCALVLEPTANRLQAMVITEGGKLLGDPSLATVASTVGGSGGGVYSTDAATIRGAVGGWQLAAASFDNLANNLGRRCDGTPGNVRVAVGHPMMALWFENGDVSSAFVARDAVPGRPELNAMNTPLVMNSVQAVNGACAVGGAIAQDGTGRILSCQNGTWRPSGDGTCLPTSADLNLLEEGGRCYNGAGLPNSPAGGDWVFVEVFRHYDPVDYFATQRVMGMTGNAYGKTWTRNQQSNAAGTGWSAWNQVEDRDVALAGGNVAAAGTITANANIAAGGSVSAGGNLNASGSVAAGAHVNAGGTVQGSALHAFGSVTANQDVQAAATVYGQNIFSFGGVEAMGNVISHNTLFSASETWALQGLTAGFAGNAEPTNARGSLYVNDIFLRSIGKWASQLMVNPGYICILFQQHERGVGYLEGGLFFKSPFDATATLIPAPNGWFAQFTRCVPA